MEWIQCTNLLVSVGLASPLGAVAAAAFFAACLASWLK